MSKQRTDPPEEPYQPPPYPRISGGWDVRQGPLIGRSKSPGGVTRPVLLLPRRFSSGDVQVSDLMRSFTGSLLEPKYYPTRTKLIIPRHFAHASISYYIAVKL